jgi:hypothetical protein
MQGHIHLLLCFFGYAIASYLGTILFKAIQHDKAGASFLVEFGQTIFGATAIAALATHPDPQSIFAAAFGGASGTYVALRIRRKLRERHKGGGDRS